MTDETPEKTEPSHTDKAKAGAQKAAEMADRATTTLDGAQNAFSAIKWASIALICITALVIVWFLYKTLYKPVAVVGETAGNVVEAVGDGAGKAMDVVGDGAGAIKDGASDVINRLVIPAANQADLNSLSESAFMILNNMAKTKPEGVRDRMFRRTNFSGSESKICRLALDFGNGEIIAYAAADNEAHATAKSVGSKDDRLMRFVIKADDDDIDMNTLWDEDSSNWVMKWKKTMVKKPVSNEIAQARMKDIMTAIPDQCDQ